VQFYAPQAYFVFQEGFEGNWKTWNDLFDPDDVDMVAMDTHGYLAWNGNPTNATHNASVEDYCASFEDRA
jgi:hypothetical protein